jgi:hypothetical protein
MVIGVESTSIGCRPKDRRQTGNCGTGRARSVRVPFELMALKWDVELRGFESRTSPPPAHLSQPRASPAPPRRTPPAPRPLDRPLKARYRWREAPAPRCALTCRSAHLGARGSRNLAKSALGNASLKACAWFASGHWIVAILRSARSRKLASPCDSVSGRAEAGR